ncbi:hypothetical protein E2C01_007180 [Portunus trituberculatus]|uniref:Uncharacterized protein n=1 Tax=Portunus trituberculatus TaxID=210409 RepID=A0A5B7D3Q7_PORTR|nr:hypothetical protein [Portunus trituberculatus]
MDRHPHVSRVQLYRMPPAPRVLGKRLDPLTMRVSSLKNFVFNLLTVVEHRIFKYPANCKPSHPQSSFWGYCGEEKAAWPLPQPGHRLTTPVTAGLLCTFHTVLLREVPALCWPWPGLERTAGQPEGSLSYPSAPWQFILQFLKEMAHETRVLKDADDDFHVYCYVEYCIEGVGMSWVSQGGEDGRLHQHSACSGAMRDTVTSGRRRRLLSGHEVRHPSLQGGSRIHVHR